MFNCGFLLNNGVMLLVWLLCGGRIFGDVFILGFMGVCA